MLLGIVLWALIVWQEYGLLIIRLGSSTLGTYRRAEKSTRCEKERCVINSKRIQLTRNVVANCSGSFVTATALLMPAPIQPTVPGIVELHDPITIRTQSDGTSCGFMCSITGGRNWAIAGGVSKPRLGERCRNERIEVALTTGIHLGSSCAQTNSPRHNLNRPNSIRFVNNFHNWRKTTTS